jgi:hypothetical protein
VLDRRRGLRTTEARSNAELGFSDPDRVYYEPSPWGALKRVLNASDVGPEDVFVDVGAGCGRAVYLAAHFPFARVEGIEVSEHLVEVARANLERARPRLRCQNLRVVNADALAGISDDVTFVYLFNPFRRDIFSGFLEQVVASIDREPREITLIYRLPIEHELMLATGRATLTKVHAGWRFSPRGRLAQTVHIYRLR